MFVRTFLIDRSRVLVLLSTASLIAGEDCVSFAVTFYSILKTFIRNEIPVECVGHGNQSPAPAARINQRILRPLLINCFLVTI